MPEIKIPVTVDAYRIFADVAVGLLRDESLDGKSQFEVYKTTLRNVGVSGAFVIRFLTEQAAILGVGHEPD